jgi:hypothetical protein
VPGHHVDLVDLHLTRQAHVRRLGDEAVAQLLGHDLHVRGAQAQFRGELPVGQVQTHEVEAQHPHPQRLVVPGQHRPGEVVEARRTGLAAIPLSVRLRVVVPVPHHRLTATSRAADALRPAMLTHQGEAPRVIEQGCEVDRVRAGHDDESPSCSLVTTDRSEPSPYPNSPPQASITPEADKSHKRFPDYAASSADFGIAQSGNKSAFPER